MAAAEGAFNMPFDLTTLICVLRNSATGSIKDEITFFSIEITFKRTSIAQRSFFNRALTSWNELSEELKNCTNLISFKRLAQKEILSYL